MKSRSTRAASDRYLAAIHRKLGNVLEATVTGWKVQGTSHGTFVAIGYKTTFRGGVTTESFTFRRDARSAKLVGYDNTAGD